MVHTSSSLIMLLSLALFIFSTVTTASSKPRLDCRPPGPIVPRPRGLSSDPTFLNATSRLKQAIESAIAGGDEVAGWPVANVSFSIGVVAWDDGDEEDGLLLKEEIAWQYHHLGANNEQGTKHIDADSQYLIGSVSKVISDYILLNTPGVDQDAVVTEFLPELLLPANSTEEAGIKWQDVTLRMLAGHMAGIPVNYGFSEYYYLKDYFEALGYPQIDDSAYPTCGVIGLNGDCSKEEFLLAMRTIRPVTPPSTRPVYSNIAFNLFVLCLEVATGGETYTQLLSSLVAEPLNLTSTFESPGNDSLAVIPPVDNSWGSDYGDNAPQGGLVSSLADLSRFFREVLRNYDDASVSTTKLFNGSTTALNTWLKPSSAVTGSPHTTVGLPWELYRAEGLTPQHPRTVDIYAKGGSAYGYQAWVGAVPELGLAVVVLSAGSAAACNYVFDAALAGVVGAADEVARQQAEEAYGGVYASSQTLTSDAASGEEADVVAINATITQDSSSLILSGLYRDGHDMLDAYRELWAVTMAAFIDQKPVTARVYPVNVLDYTTHSAGGNATKEVVREDWRVEWDMEILGHTSLPGSEPGVSMTRGFCMGWQTTDWVHYGAEALDRLVFIRDVETGDVIGVEVPYLRSGVLGKGAD